MKKIILSIFLLSVVSFSSCSSSDDNLNEDCQTCSGVLGGENGSADVCDNGDGTVTLTDRATGETETVEGDYDIVITGLKASGLTCN